MTASDQGDNIGSLARRASAEFLAQDLADLKTGAAEDGSSNGKSFESKENKELVDTRIHPLHLLDTKTEIRWRNCILCCVITTLSLTQCSLMYFRKLAFQELKVSACGQN